MKTDLDGVLAKALNASDCYEKLHRDYKILNKITSPSAKGKNRRERIVRRVYDFAYMYKSFYSFVRNLGGKGEFEREEIKVEEEMEDLIKTLSGRGYNDLSVTLQRTDLEVTFPEGIVYG